MVKLIGITRDRSQRQQAEQDLQRLSRTHAVLSRCNRSLARAVDERALLDAFCANLVEVGGYGFAWVGYAGRGGSGRVRLVAHASLMDGTFPTAVYAAFNSRDGRSACRVACERGEPVILRDLSASCELAPWADAALRRGLRSMIALPLQADGGPFGNFSIFADAADAFDAPEVALLAELAEDLAFGIQTLRARAAEAQAVRRLRNDAERDARGRLAASLHDGVGQTLQALNLGLKQAREMVQRQEAVQPELLERLLEEVGDALREVRALSCELRPPFLDRLPLLDAVRLQCSEMAQGAGVSIRVHADESPIALDDRVKEQCFLAFREALSNAVRHAQASRILVVLRARPEDRLVLVVIDNGVGFDTRQTFERPAGLGLCMIRERAEGILGCARIRSNPGRGTQVRISVPLSREPTPWPLSVILADDHAIFRQGLAAMLQAEPDIALLAQAADGEAAWRVIETHQPDIAILDLAMPKATGIEVACRVEAAALNTRVVLLTMHDDAAAALQAQEAGVAGYVLKDNSFEELIMAVRSIAAGGTFVTPAVRAKLRAFQSDGQKAAVLSPREREVIRLITGARAARRSGGCWPSALGPWIPIGIA